MSVHAYQVKSSLAEIDAEHFNLHADTLLPFVLTAADHLITDGARTDEGSCRACRTAVRLQPAGF